jgi:uncharacterized protein
MSFEHVDRWRIALHDEFDAAYRSDGAARPPRLRRGERLPAARAPRGHQRSTMNLPPELDTICAAFPHRLIFATVSGAHLYGFPSPDSDFDLRGCHVLPVAAVVGLDDPVETEERLGVESGIDLDLVSHDLRKFGRMLLKPNGYVLEQLLSPLVVRTSSDHAALIDMVPRLLTRHHAHHYLGFARSQWRLFEKEPRVKSLLYVYRVLLTGIHLMRSGEVQPSLPALLADRPVSGLADLIAQKISGAEKQPLPATAVAHHAVAIRDLTAELEAARDSSDLADAPRAKPELDALLRAARLGS